MQQQETKYMQIYTCKWNDLQPH